MFLPRFSLRWLLAVVTACGFLAYLLSQAVMGQAWGIAVSVALGAFALTAIMHAMVFVLAWGFASVGAGVRKSRASSPFAVHVAPPQILPPQDPD